jgi:hypothetical protein
MERRKRAVKSESWSPDGRPTESVEHGACAVCATRDARLLVMVELPGGAAATLCGSHALMQSRIGKTCRTITELRVALAQRRNNHRRATGEGDELAERLSAAFIRERRGSTERRAG